jgi:hypothetical protein
MMFSFIIPSGLFDCQSNKGRNADAGAAGGDPSPAIIARSASDEAIHLYRAMDCFADARNDGKDQLIVIIRAGG